VAGARRHAPVDDGAQRRVRVDDRCVLPRPARIRLGHQPAAGPSGPGRPGAHHLRPGQPDHARSDPHADPDAVVDTYAVTVDPVAVAVAVVDYGRAPVQLEQRDAVEHQPHVGAVEHLVRSGADRLDASELTGALSGRPRSWHR